MGDGYSVKDALRCTRCCFTGHRPQSLKRPEDDIRVDLENIILASAREGCHTFISGMACRKVAGLFCQSVPNLSVGWLSFSQYRNRQPEEQNSDLWLR